MAKYPKPGGLVVNLRQTDVLISHGQIIAFAILALGIISVTSYR